MGSEQKKCSCFRAFERAPSIAAVSPTKLQESLQHWSSRKLVHKKKTGPRSCGTFILIYLSLDWLMIAWLGIRKPHKARNRTSPRRLCFAAAKSVVRLCWSFNDKADAEEETMDSSTITFTHYTIGMSIISMSIWMVFEIDDFLVSKKMPRVKVGEMVTDGCSCGVGFP